MPTLADNKSIGFSFDIHEKYEAGIALTGPEVKAVKRGNLNLKGSYVSIRPNGAWLLNCYISPYKPAANVQAHYKPTRERKLLLHRRELGELIGHAQTKGLTILPISFYTKGGYIKVALGVAKGKKLHDKRAQIKKRDVERSIQRAMRAKP